MNWNKTAISLIIILVFVNIILGSMLYSTYNEVKTIDKELIYEAVENLSGNGVLIDSHSVNNNIYSDPVYTYSEKVLFADSIENAASDQYPVTVAAMQYLSEQRENADIRYFDIPGGISASVFDKKGSLVGTSIIGRDMLFEYYKNGFDPDSIREQFELDNKRFSDSVSSGKKRAVKKFFSAVYPKNTVGFDSLLGTSVGKGELLRCSLSLDGLKISDSDIFFYFEKDELLFVSGKLFSTVPEKAYENRLIDGINILYSLNAAVQQEISVISEEIVYSILEYDDGYYYIVPAWSIKYRDDEGEKKITLNALTGGKV